MKQAREIWSILRFCKQCVVVAKVYKGMEWIKNDSGVVGFLCSVKGGDGSKSSKMEKVKEYCDRADLQVVIEDIPTHLVNFKVVIKK